MAVAAGERGCFEILVNNAGIPGPTAPLVDISLEEWNDTLAVNLTGVFLACGPPSRTCPRLNKARS